MEDCDPEDKYVKYYLQDNLCFEGISAFFKADIENLQYGVAE